MSQGDCVLPSGVTLSTLSIAGAANVPNAKAESPSPIWLCKKKRPICLNNSDNAPIDQFDDDELAQR